ncbi:MAG TPA: 4-hydroxy-3-methylbut-2-enyl diphosphate reductase, partial [Sphingomicrobium sp.]|nr:4-hydroxy-3-methylbut-2-enyl diphosphate reductase [Sphingomicrobium sp.]
AVRDALERHGAPVYVRRPIVHNLEVVRTLEAEGAVFVEELDEVPPGSVVLFSAHGVSPAIAEDATARGLISYDAVCPLVSKVHREVERHQRAGRAVILIGHRGHPEIEGTLGHVRQGWAFVVRSAEDVRSLPLASDTPAAYAVQTTYSVEEAQAIVEALRARFCDLVEPPSADICYATTNRQTAVRAVAKRANHVLIVGEHFSSNACRLVEVARSHCPGAQLVAAADEINWNALPRQGIVGIGAAASTPESSVEAVISALGRRYELTIEEMRSTRESAVFKPMELA